MPFLRGYWRPLIMWEGQSLCNRVDPTAPRNLLVAAKKADVIQILGRSPPVIAINGDTTARRRLHIGLLVPLSHSLWSSLS